MLWLRRLGIYTLGGWLCLSLFCWGCGSNDPGLSGYQGSCPAKGCSLPGTALRFEPYSSGNFFLTPWPAQTRMQADGRIDLTGFPNPGDSSLLETALQSAQANIWGFGTNTAIFFSFDGGIDPKSLPAFPEASLQESSTVFLVGLSDGPDRGKRIPLEVHFFKAARQFTPENTLVLRPVMGRPLRSATRYAVVVTRAAFGEDGRPLGSSSDFERTKYRLAPLDEKLLAWWQELQPVYDLLEQLSLVQRGDIAACTVFTTQVVFDEMDRIAAYVAEQPVPLVSGWKLLQRAADYFLIEGWFEIPEFQAGVPPFLSEGGGFAFDQAGNPVVQRRPKIPFALAIPRDTVSMPSSGFPIVIQAHGTGGDRFSHFLSKDDPAAVLGRLKIASFGIDQPLHATRNTGGWDETTATFNVLNFVSFRDNLRQGAVDLLAVRRLLSDFRVPANVSPTGKDILINGNQVALLGHSQGGTTGGIFLGVARNVPGAMLSGAGGGMIEGILERTLPMNLKGLVALGYNMEPSEMDMDNPALNLFQTFMERADTLNYALRNIAEPLEGESSRNLFFSEGLHDEYVVPKTIEALAAASGCSQMSPVVQVVEAIKLAQRADVSPPAQGNLVGSNGEPVTAVLVQYPDDGHFPIFYNPDARRYYGQFFDSLFRNGLAAVGP